MTPPRPLLRWFGGKWTLAPWIIDHMPPHRTYVEPFAGGASVLLRKPRAHVEVLNDLDSEVVNLYRVLRDPIMSEALIALLHLTPYSAEEFEAAYAHSDDPVERARRLLVRSFMGHGSGSARLDRSTGFRRNAKGGRTALPREWATYPDALRVTIARLNGVMIENRPAAEVIEYFNEPDALLYVDPPYVWETRTKLNVAGEPFHGYVHELDDAAHIALLDQLDAHKGRVLLSGYAHPLYDERLTAWRRVTVTARADSTEEREEVLWINPAASQTGGLFA